MNKTEFRSLLSLYNKQHDENYLNHILEYIENNVSLKLKDIYLPVTILEKLTKKTQNVYFRNLNLDPNNQNYEQYIDYIKKDDELLFSSSYRFLSLNSKQSLFETMYYSTFTFEKFFGTITIKETKEFCNNIIDYKNTNYNEALYFFPYIDSILDIDKQYKFIGVVFENLLKNDNDFSSIFHSLKINFFSDKQLKANNELKETLTILDKIISNHLHYNNNDNDSIFYDILKFANGDDISVSKINKYTTDENHKILLNLILNMNKNLFHNLHPLLLNLYDNSNNNNIKEECEKLLTTTDLSFQMISSFNKHDILKYQDLIIKCLNNKVGLAIHEIKYDHSILPLESLCIQDEINEDLIKCIITNYPQLKKQVANILTKYEKNLMKEYTEYCLSDNNNEYKGVQNVKHRI